MLLIHNNESFYNRHFKDGGLFESIHDHVDDKEEIHISVKAGHTIKEKTPTVKGFAVELSHNGYHFIQLYMFDIGRDDEYFSTMSTLVEKYKKLKEKGIYAWDEKCVAVLRKMKDLAYKFTVQYCNDPGYLILGIANRAYNRGTENGKYQLQEAMKELLNVKE